MDNEEEPEWQSSQPGEIKQPGLEPRSDKTWQ